MRPEAAHGGSIRAIARPSKRGAGVGASHEAPCMGRTAKRPGVARGAAHGHGAYRRQLGICAGGACIAGPRWRMAGTAAACHGLRRAARGAMQCGVSLGAAVHSHRHQSDLHQFHISHGGRYRPIRFWHGSRAYGYQYQCRHHLGHRRRVGFGILATTATVTNNGTISGTGGALATASASRHHRDRDQ